jgi:hypothetical protein
MLTSKYKFAAGIALAAIFAAGGSAFTQGGLTGIPDAFLGAKRISVSGAAATSVVYDYNTALDQVNSIVVVFSTDLTGHALSVTPTYNGTANDNTSTATLGTAVACTGPTVSGTTFTCGLSAATAAEWKTVDVKNIDYKLS